MREELLQWLCCPACRSVLSVTADRSDEDGGVAEGRLVCGACEKTYPIARSIPRFVSGDRYSDSFSYQWHAFSRTQLASTRHAPARTFEYTTGLALADLDGDLVLDVGVGTGRHACVVEEAGATVVGVDLSYSIDVAHRNFGGRKRLHLVQADVFSLPFPPGTFDTAYSIGVLHHTPDCRGAFEAMVPLVKEGGRLAIWVYAHARSRTEEKMNHLWRALTTRLPRRVLLPLSGVASLVSYVKLVPLVHPLLKYGLPRIVWDAVPIVSNRRHFSERVLDTFDWYSPKYQSRHSYPEVVEWFRGTGLDEIELGRKEISVRGRVRRHDGIPPDPEIVTVTRARPSPSARSL